MAVDPEPLIHALREDGDCVMVCIVVVQLDVHFIVLV